MLRMFALIVTVALTHLVNAERYVIDNDNDLGTYFAFPIDICIKSRVLENRFIKYTCSRTGMSMEKRIYSDPLCEGAPDDYDSLYTSGDTSPCGSPAFSCDGHDQYQTTGYSTTNLCRSQIASVQFSLGCYCDSNSTSYQIGCSTDTEQDVYGDDVTTYAGQVSRYNDTNCSIATNAPNVTQTQDLTECFLAEDSLSLDIYAKITECVLSVPTPAPTIKPKEIADKQVAQLDKIYLYFSSAFGAIFGVVVLLSWIDAWYIRTNDYFKISAIGTMIFQTIDMMSDCFFTAQLSVQYKVLNKFHYQIMLYLSMLFIILPSLTALFQLYFYAKKHWLGNDYVRAWLSHYSAFLLAISMLTGSSFSAVQLLNSYIFQIEIFDMGLTDKELKAFNTRRIWSVVVLENIPQLTLQASYFALEGGDIFDSPIALSSMVFSVVSIIISLMTLTMEKTINKTQRSVTISMDVTGECVEGASKCRTMSYKLRKLLAPLFGVDFHVIEVVKPMYVTGGLSLDIIVYVNEQRRGVTLADYKAILVEANESGKLGRIIQEAWKLSNLPYISSIQHKLLESKVDRKNTAREMQKTTATADSQFHDARDRVHTATADNPQLSQYEFESVQKNQAKKTSGDDSAPPPTFNPLAKVVHVKKVASQSEVEMQMESEILMQMEQEGGGGQNEGEGEGGGGGVQEGNDESNKLIENLVRMGYEDRANNKIAIKAANGDINVAIQYLKQMKAKQKKKVVFVDVDEEDMPPPPKYNPKARKASNAQRKKSQT